MKITILKGTLEGHSFEMNNDILLIGRAPDSDIHIPDPSISRLHAKIFKSGDKYFIKDLKSCNGTWVDGRLIWPGNEIELKQGLRLSVGDTLLTLDDFESHDNSAFSYSIDLTSEKERGSIDCLFKDRRIAKRKNLELICEISEALLRPMELDTICEKILDYIFFSLKRINSCAILMVDKNNSKIYKLMDKTRDSHHEEDVNYSQNVVWKVVNEEKALMIADLDNQDEIAPSESMELMGIKSIMCVPLISKTDTIGVIYAHSVDESKGFRKDDLYMLVALSSYASIAIDNATQHALKKQGLQNIDIQVILRHKLETIKNLAGVVSHEFNNLLMCIQGEISLLLYNTPEKDTKYGRMKQVEKYIGKGAELSALACGIPVAPQDFKTCCDLNGLAADSVKNFEYLPEESFYLEPSHDLWPVNIDEKQIMQALTNVFFFFMSVKNRGIINIRCENIIPDSYSQELSGFERDSLVKISICDNKNHLEKDDLLEIFTPGINLEQNTGQNIGAGLITAYWIIEKNMGRLVVTSDRERGTEFCIYLPALEEKQVEVILAVG